MMPGPRLRKSLFVGLAAAALIALAPALHGAQGLPPALFFGSTADVTIDGAAYDGEPPIEFVDGDGAVVTAMQDFVWSVQVPNGSGNVRFRLGPALSQPFTVTAGAVNADVVLSLVTQALATQRTLQLVAGANFLTYTGPDVDVAGLVAGFPNAAAIEAIFAFDSSTQTYQTARRGGPACLDTLDGLVQNQTYVFSMNAPLTWQMPIAPLQSEGPNEVALAAGFTALPWLEADAADTAGITMRIADVGAVRAIFTFNNATQTFAVLRPGEPAFLSTLTQVDRYDLLFLQADSPTTWTQVIVPPLAAEEEVPAAAATIVIASVELNGAAGAGTLRNVSSAQVSLDGYWLCQLPNYSPLPNVTLAPGEELEVRLGSGDDAPGLHFAGTALGSFNAGGGEIALYRDSSFGSSDSIVAYAAWGSGGGRGDVARAAGIWGAENVQASQGDTLVHVDGTGADAYVVQ